MSSCSGARLQTRPERDASAEWSNPPPPAQVSWKCFKIGTREHEACPNGSIPACDGSFCGLGKGERVKARRDRCAAAACGERESPPTEPISRISPQKRDNFDGCPTCAGEERRATGQQRLDSVEARPACPESSSQLQSASHPPVKDSQAQTSPSCIKHFIQLFSLHHAFQKSFTVAVRCISVCDLT